MKLVRSILERIESGSEVLASDLAHIRMFFAQGGFFSSLMGMFGFGPKTARSPKRKKKDNLEEEEEDYI